MKTVTEAIPTGATLIDVRNAYEFEEEHIKGALNIPLDQVIQNLPRFKSLPKPLVIYCRSGGRSGMAVMALKQAGIKDVINGGGLYDVKQLIN